MWWRRRSGVVEKERDVDGVSTAHLSSSLLSWLIPAPAARRLSACAGALYSPPGAIMEGTAAFYLGSAPVTDATNRVIESVRLVASCGCGCRCRPGVVGGLRCVFCVQCGIVGCFCVRCCVV